MKIAIITDTHWGIRGDSPVFLERQNEFYQNIFFPTLEKNNIKTIIHCGDLVDKRKSINFNTSKWMRESFLDKLTNYHVHIITGNHDIYYKSTNSVNVFRELLRSYPFHIYEESTEVTIHDQPMVFIPWINQENTKHTHDIIESTTAPLAFGHLEITGFEMFKGAYCEHGLNKSIFDKFDMVFSGHFHHKSTQSNIYYLGAPYQMTWSDYGFDRGFHLFDLETRELEFIKNPYQMFHKLFYDDTDVTLEVLKQNIEDYNVGGSYIKVIVEVKNDPYLFDMFVEHVESQKPYDLKIVDALTIMGNNNTIIDKTEDTHTILMNSIDDMEISTDKKKLKSLMSNLYKESINIEVD